MQVQKRRETQEIQIWKDRQTNGKTKRERVLRPESALYDAPHSNIEQSLTIRQFAIVAYLAEVGKQTGKLGVNSHVL